MASVVALLAALATVGVLLLRPGGLLNPDHVAPGLALALADRHPEAPPVSQTSALKCFQDASSVSSIRVAGTTLMIRFSDERHDLRMRFWPSEDAATRRAYGVGAPGASYANTTWSRTPARFDHADIVALSHCVPLPRPH